MATGFGTGQRGSDMFESVSIGRFAGLDLTTVGRIHIVKDTSDSDWAEFTASFPKQHQRFRRYSTVAAALTATRTGTNDYVIVCPKYDGSTWEQTATLTMSKNMVHLIGLNGSRGQQAEIDFVGDFGLAITGTGMEVGNLKITGSGGSNTYAISMTAPAVDTWIHDCEIYADPANASAVYDITTAAVGRTTIQRCIIGHGGSISGWSHGAETCVDNASGGGVLQIEDCTFLHEAAAAGDQFIFLHSAGSAPVIVRNCTFHNFSTTVMSQAISGGRTNGCMVHDSSMFGAVSWGTAANVFVSPSEEGGIHRLESLDAVVGTTEAIFTVSGGLIEIVALWGEVETVIGATPGNLKIVAGATDICAATAIENDADGDYLWVTGDFSDVMTAIAAGEAIEGGGAAAETPIVVDSCSITANYSADPGSGKIRFHMLYRKLGGQATVVAA